jgi:hypothetical protein
MRVVIISAIFSFVLLMLFSQVTFSQTNCEGRKIFTEKNCAGDEVSQTEKDLVRIVNEYRTRNNLPAITFSGALSVVANRHLLDLTRNFKSITHAWSNCPYDVKIPSTWKCVFESPKRLNVGYSGNGFENLYRNNDGAATPSLALEAWKKSDLHNSLILNLNIFKDINFDAFGVAINGEYAALWFGSAVKTSTDVNNPKYKGLGVSFDKIVSGLSGIVKINNEVSISGELIAASADKSIILETSGSKENVSSAAFSIKIKVNKNFQLTQQNNNLLQIFLNNLASDWKEKDVWIENSIKKLRQNSKKPQTINQANKTFVMNLEAGNYLCVSVKPNSKPSATEIN